MIDYIYNIKFSIIIIIGELLLILIFLFMGLYKNQNCKNIITSIIKGMTERVFLTICLINDLPSSLILFGTLKIGTRIVADSSDKNKITNDQFLIGNIISVSLGILYFIHYTH